VDARSRVVNSRYPIIEAGMNPASDLKLALAVHDAGAYPCIAVWAYLHVSEREEGSLEFKPDLAAFAAALEGFRKHTGGTDLLVTVFVRHLFNNGLLRLLESYAPAMIELVYFHKAGLGRQKLVSDRMVRKFARDNGVKPPDTIDDTVKRNISRQNMRRLKAAGCRILLRGASSERPFDLGLKHYDGFTIKGAESAGHNGKSSVWDNFVAQRRATPELICIPYGGVGTPQDVRRYMDAGADAVGVGTLLAATRESCLSEATKLKMVGAKSSDVTKIGKHGQNALVFRPLDCDDDFNANKSLRAGLFGNAEEGHMYAGKAIDHVTSIRSVKEVVEYLASEL
jgi:hypothetical protein